MSKENCKQEITNKMKMLQLGLTGLELLPDEEQFDFPVDVSTSLLSTQITLYVRLPYNLQVLQQYRKAMGNGWKMEDNWYETQHEDSVSYHNNWIRPELSPDGKDYLNPFGVSLTMYTDIEKSVCHIEQVGVKEVPVWKVVCE